MDSLDIYRSDPNSEPLGSPKITFDDILTFDLLSYVCTCFTNACTRLCNYVLLFGQAQYNEHIL